MFYTFPFKAYWQSSTDEPEEQVYSEIYTDDIWNAEHEKVHGIPHSGKDSDLVPAFKWGHVTTKYLSRSPIQ